MSNVELESGEVGWSNEVDGTEGLLSVTSVCQTYMN